VIANDRRTRSSSPWRGAGTTLRATFGATALLVRRRARRDLVLVSAWVLLVAFTGVLALVVPRAVSETLDEGARQTVAAAGPAADVLVRVAIGDPKNDLSTVTPQQALDIAEGIRGQLPPALERVTGSVVTATLTSPSFAVVRPVRDSAGTPGPLEAAVGLVDPELQSTLVLTAGRLPAETKAAEPIEVLVSTATAANLGAEVGTVITETNPTADSLRFVVVGIVTVPAAEGADPFADLPGFREPHESPARLGITRTTITALTTAEGIERIEPEFSRPIPATIRFAVDPGRFTADLLSEVSTEVKGLMANSSRLAGDTAAAVQVSSSFVDAVAGFPTQARAALAQISLLTSGLLGVALTVVVLLSRLIVTRRRGELVIERARGASLASTAVRALAEAIPATVVGLALAIGAARVLGPVSLTEPALLLAVAAVSIAAAPVQSVVLALAASGARRQPANRGDRHEVVVRRRVRRLVIEGAAVVLAIGALYSVRQRGLVATRLDGIDPLLVCAPLLVAVAVTILVLRIYPIIVRGIARLSTRTRGALGVLGAMQAERALAAVPVFALTLAVALAVTGGLLVDSVRSGQVDASWQRIGADARVESASEDADDEVATLARAPGVTAVGSFESRLSIEISGGQAFLSATLLAVDSGYADVVDALPALSVPASGDLRDVGAASGAESPLPVVVNSELKKRLAGGDFVLRIEQDRVPIEVVGVEDHGPSGYLGGNFIYVDRAALNERLDLEASLEEGERVTSILVVGPGAEGAADALADDSHEVLTRSTWLAEQRGLALVGGVTTTMTLASGAVALLALLAMVASVIASGRERSRSFALLRTLGVTRGVGWWLALSELAPVLLASLLGGILAGVGSVLVLGPALGLAVLTGGVGDPALQISGLVIGGVVVVAVAVLGIALLVDVAVQRRHRVSEVLRVGETV